jgi:hypothetical protein
MSKWPKIFLVFSIVTLVFGLTSAGSSIAYGALKPAGAIFFGLFLITQILNKEIAQYDEEMRSKKGLRKAASSAGPAPTGATPGRMLDAASLATGRSA